MIVNITDRNFGGRIRNGDILGVLNLIQHLRNVNNNQEIKAHLPDNAILDGDVGIKFRNWLISNTDFMTSEQGDINLEYENLNVWDYRALAGDILVLPNPQPMEKKICIFPIFDGPYNNYRNWPVELLQDLIDKFADSKYHKYEKVICIKDPISIDLKGFVFSTGYIDNINHIATCEYFIGGETGTSLLASVLNNDKRKLYYYYSTFARLHTVPFHVMQGKGTINMFFEKQWVNPF